MSIQLAPKQNENIDMSKLFIDVQFSAVSFPKPGSPKTTSLDFTGRKTFNVGFMREGVGFGIVDIQIESNASLQPLVTIKFKDLYGNTVFRKNSNFTGSDIDFSALFDWPPPKFELTFKGYLGKPVTWILNLKKNNVVFNSTDGSFDITSTFVPNVWGFFADLPFLYLLAKKKLEEDIPNTSPLKTPEQKKIDDDKVKTIFDLIKIGKKIEFKQQQVTKEFDKLQNQLSVLKTDATSGLITDLFSVGDIIDGKTQGRGAVGSGSGSGDPFSPITIALPKGYEGLDKGKVIEKLKTSSGDKLAIEHKRILIASVYPNSTILSKTDFGKLPSPETADAKIFDSELAIARTNLDVNIKKVEDEIKRRTFDVKTSELGGITISEVFSTLAGDAAFMLGSILDAGNIGLQKNSGRATNSSLIGLNFPLIIDQQTKLQIPDKDSGIDLPGAEMDFVRRFITAVAEGIASQRELLENNDLSQENKLVSRINNLEILSDNPYKPGMNVKSLSESILIRSGIATFITRSFDPNRPGDYNSGLFGTDKDSQKDIVQLADKELKNITDNVLTKFDNSELQELKKFCRFFNKLFDEEGNFIDALGTTAPVNPTSIDDIKKFLVVLAEDSRLLGANRTQEQLNAINNDKTNANGATLELTSVEQFFQKFTEQNSIFFTSAGNTNNNKSLTNTIDFNTFIATELNHNQLSWKIPVNKSDEDLYLFFNKPEDISKLNEINNSETDVEFADKKNKDKESPLGLVKVTNGHGKDSDVNEERVRLTVLNNAISQIDGFAIDYNSLIVSNNNGGPTFIKDKIDENNIGSGVDYIIYTRTTSEDQLVWGLFTFSSRGRNQRVFLKHICNSLLNKLTQLENDKNAVISQVVGKAGSNENALYTQMHHIYHQWGILGKNDSGSDQNDLATKLQEDYKKQVVFSGSSEPNSDFGFVYSYPLQEVDPSLSEVSKIKVEHSIVNIEPLYKPNVNTTILNLIQSICTKNNFFFIPIPGNSLFKNINDILKPSISPISAQKNIGNFFNVMFMPTPESRHTINDDNLLNNNIKEHKNTINAFEVSFGSPDNHIIKNIQVSTDDNKPTAESILNLQRLVDKENTNKTTLVDCSTLSVMEGRSYRMNCEMLGNAQISPTQHFFVNNMPIFGGLYLILKVSHSITPNNMNTSFEGVKMRFGDGSQGSQGGIPPITLETIQSLGGAANIEQPVVQAPVTFNSLSESIYGNSNVISQSLIDKVKNERFANSLEIDNFFKKFNATGFVDWFRKTVGTISVFNGKRINDVNFKKFWDNSIPIIFGNNQDGKVNLFEFLALNTIIIEETGGNFLSKSAEIVNSINHPEHPGIAYAFDKVPLSNGSTKKSYNSPNVNGNRTALQLFNDTHYKDAHKNLPFGDKLFGLIDTTNAKWEGQSFPKELFKDLKKAIDPNQTTFLTEADFFKLRGRGFIQVTGREIYKKIINFILNYKGSNLKVKQYQNMWNITPFNKNADVIATRSTNIQWDDLFSNTDSVVASESITLHAQTAGNYQYIPINSESNLVSTPILNKILNVAKRINSSPEYQERFKNRILLQTDAIDKG